MAAPEDDHTDESGGAHTPLVCVQLLFEGCDVMDVVGPYEVLLTAARLTSRQTAEPAFEVRTVSVDGGPVTGYGGLGLVPSHGALGDQPAMDLLVVPGLVDVEQGVRDATLVQAIRLAAAHASITASVCTGAFLLERAGVTADLDVTTHWEDVPRLHAQRSETGDAGSVRPGVRWVDEGHVVTAGGISAGIDAALHLVERMAGRALAVATARQIDHRWDETS